MVMGRWLDSRKPVWWRRDPGCVLGVPWNCLVLLRVFIRVHVYIPFFEPCGL